MASGTGARRTADPVRDGLVSLVGVTRLLVVGGRDRLRFLHAVTTQDVQGLAPGEGAYGAVTDDRGHPVGDFHVFVLPQVVLLEIAASRATALREAIERWIVADDVALAWADGTVVSVESGDPERVAQVVGRPAEHLTDVRPGVSWSEEAAAGGGGEVDLASIPLAAGVVARRSQWGGYGAFHLVPTAPSDPERDSMLDALEIEAGRAGEAELAEARVWSELGIEGAVSFTKGCFPGQEILNRVRSRGELKRRLVGIVLEESQPVADRLSGAPLEAADGRRAGIVTRASGIHALAFVGREWWAPGSALAVRRPDGGRANARVAALPFVERRKDGMTPPPFLRAEVR